MKIFLKNKSQGQVHQVAYPDDTLLKPTFTIIRKDEEGFKAFSVSGDLVFIDEDYTFIKNELIDHVNALENEVEITFVDDCCPTGDDEYIFKILPESLKWCENSCTLTAAAVEKSQEEEALKCLRNTMIWDDTPTNWSDGVSFKKRQHPRMTYCNEIRPQWHHDFVMIAAIILVSISNTLWPITIMLAISIVPVIKTIQFIVNAINSIPGVNVSLPSELENFLDQFDSVKEVMDKFKDVENMMIDNIIGCGRKHPSPLVRDYAKNVCAKCGLVFNSSIFNSGNSDYFNAVYHFAPVDKGTPKNDFTTFWIENNAPNLSGVQFFDQLKGLFNAEWNVKNGVLQFERKDFFQPKTPWLDVTQLEETEYELCYNWSKKPRPAYASFEYMRDAVNTVGAEANFRWGQRFLEWNKPPKSGQKGEFKPLLEFAACRFRDDHIRMNDGPERDVLTFYENFALTQKRIADRIKDFKNVMLLNQHLCYTPMILIWDPSFDPAGTGNTVQDARVNPDQFIPNSGDPNLPLFQNNSKATPPGEYYNYPMWFDSQMPNNMYTNFWQIEDPRNAGFKQGIDYQLTVELTCVRITQRDLFGMVKTPLGNGRIDEIVISYPTNTMTIKGTI